MTRADVWRRIEEIGIVPVIRADDARLARRAVEALVDGGIPVVEITLTVPGAIALIRELAAQLAGTALVGAGTVRSGAEARAAIQAGARFIVSPGFDAEIILAAHALDVPALPGALTPTEIMAATRAGADGVKIFPCAALGGPKYLQALRAPFPRLRAMPTGGVSLANAAQYIAAGAAALGVGAELVDVSELATGDCTRLRERALAFITTVREARSKLVASDITQSSGHDSSVGTPPPVGGA